MFKLCTLENFKILVNKELKTLIVSIVEMPKTINDAAEKTATREELVITPTPVKPFDVVIIDLIGKLPTPMSGHCFAVTIICDLTKYLFTEPIAKEANTVAQAIFDNLILKFGCPKISELIEVQKIETALLKSYVN